MAVWPSPFVGRLTHNLLNQQSTPCSSIYVIVIMQVRTSDIHRGLLARHSAKCLSPIISCRSSN